MRTQIGIKKCKIHGDSMRFVLIKYKVWFVKILLQIRQQSLKEYVQKLCEIFTGNKANNIFDKFSSTFFKWKCTKKKKALTVLFF